MHPLLKRQLKRLGLSETEPPPPAAWAALLARVSRTYDDSDQDRYTLERSLSISSKEMQELYEGLKRTSATELGKSLAVLDATLEASEDGVLVVDERGHVVRANHRCAEIWSLSRSALESMDHGQLVRTMSALAADPEAFIDLVERAAASPSATTTDEISLHDGRVLGRYSVPIRVVDATTPSPARVWFFRDVTLARRSEAELRTAKDAAEAANRAKSLFLANMSHELRTPLNAIVGFSELLGDRVHGPLNDKQAKQIGHIRDGGRHLLAVINDVLDLSRIEAGKMSLVLSRFDVVSLVGSALANVQPLADAKRVELVSEICGVGDVGAALVIADEPKFKNILFNLLSNAVKFTKRGGSIHVTLHVSDETLRISVADTGVGIGAEHLERIFLPFERALAGYESRQQGTGLGLSIARRIALLHGGSLAVESRVGHGSVFSLEIPRRLADVRTISTSPPGR